MENTCKQLLDCCLRGEPWPDHLLTAALAIDEGREFLSTVVERLGDLFEPRLCDIYAKLMSQVIAGPGSLNSDDVMKTDGLEARYRRIRQPRPWPNTADRVYVLSRVTLGADVAVTSVLLDAAKRRYPDARIYLVSSQKNYQLFAADPRISHFPAPYARSGSLRDRLDASRALARENLGPALILDPDSRLSQLGLIPIGDESNYHFFESRAYGGSGNDRLPDLAARWTGVPNATPYIAPARVHTPPPQVTVSLGVGENPSKRIDGDFETHLLRALADTGASVLVDKGATPEEHARVERALQPGMQTHDGPFAPFASQISRSRLYVGYDSAGGHVASACGIPVICIFAGEACERMFQRWRPQGTVIRAHHPESVVLDQVRQAITRTFHR